MKEKQAARYLANTLAQCYGITVSKPNSWERYGHFMQTRWRLSAAETIVAVEVIKGRSNKAIAESLQVSSETVNKHLDNIFNKSGLSGRGELSAAVLEYAEYL